MQKIVKANFQKNTCSTHQVRARASMCVADGALQVSISVYGKWPYRVHTTDKKILCFMIVLWFELGSPVWETSILTTTLSMHVAICI